MVEAKPAYADNFSNVMKVKILHNIGDNKMALDGIRNPVVSQDQITAYREQYSGNFITKAGEMESKLISTMTLESIDPGAEYLLMDAVEQNSDDDSNTPTASTGRAQTTSYSNTKFAKRQIDSNLFQKAELIKSGDLNSTLVSPTTRIIPVSLGAFNRDVDEAIITAALGSATEKYYDADGVKQTASRTFDSDMVIEDTNSKGFTWERFLQIEKMFRDVGVNVDTEEIFVVVGSNQFAEAKEDDRFINADYTGEFVLRNGAKLPMINNMVLVHSNQLPVSSSIRDCVAYTRIGMGFAWELEWDISLEVTTGYWHNYSLCMKRAYGASRLDEKRVIKFQCYEGGSMTA